MPSKDYLEYLKSPEWKLRRKIALDHAGHRCQLCNSKRQPLNAHHRTYENLGRELAADIVVLCETCHAKHHDKAKPDKWQLLVEMVARVSQTNIEQLPHTPTGLCETIFRLGLTAAIEDVTATLDGLKGRWSKKT